MAKKIDYTKARWIPKGSVKVTAKRAPGAVVYAHEVGPSAAAFAAHGTRYYALGYLGKSGKPCFHYSFRDENRRADHVKTFFDNCAASAEAKAKRVEAAKADAAKALDSIKVGDILHTSWGYDQTNVEYFEVVAKRGKVVDLREVEQTRTETGFMSGKCKPIPGKYIGPVLKNKRVSAYGIRISDCRTAFFGGGERYWSAYA